MFKFYGYIIIICLFNMLLGYSVGRRIGNKEGFEKGMSEVPLSLKLEYYQTSQCPVCSKEHGKGKTN
ncbi:hypothetical protein [Alkaliphilus hydrothermalis]|uniref:Uncharacterized protein n=1 Tax=Alkaliphilus hydrothermalis TaxID=1482730 RepID=A0ABS2NLM7_9FIRM|nr:hypothetical protein [Alkaliphilus hydrothermalis]MBM7613837.1 hypothetical protein [Alkaliphilus hydrothermalis]